MCSLAARGLWVELLGYMHEADPYGHLAIAGAAPTADQIASLVGAPAKLIRACLTELEANGVFSRDATGSFIYSRRMVRDKAKAERDRENGKGGGNPVLTKQDKPNGAGGVNPDHKAQMPDARTQMPTKASEAKASGQATDPIKDLFDTGVRILKTAGISERDARTLVGKWRKEVPDEKLIGFITGAAKATDPVAYVAGAIRRHHKPHGEAML